jgi:hypothetical protein
MKVIAFSVFAIAKFVLTKNFITLKDSSNKIKCTIYLICLYIKNGTCLRKAGFDSVNWFKVIDCAIELRIILQGIRLVVGQPMKFSVLVT